MKAEIPDLVETPSSEPSELTNLEFSYYSKFSKRQLESWHWFDKIRMLEERISELAIALTQEKKEHMNLRRASSEQEEDLRKFKVIEGEYKAVRVSVYFSGLLSVVGTALVAWFPRTETSVPLPFFAGIMFTLLSAVFVIFMSHVTNNHDKMKRHLFNVVSKFFTSDKREAV